MITFSKIYLSFIIARVLIKFKNLYIRLNDSPTINTYIHFRETWKQRALFNSSRTLHENKNTGEYVHSSTKSTTSYPTTSKLAAKTRLASSIRAFHRENGTLFPEAFISHPL